MRYLFTTLLIHRQPVAIIGGIITAIIAAAGAAVAYLGPWPAATADRDHDCARGSALGELHDRPLGA